MPVYCWRYYHPLAVSFFCPLFRALEYPALSCYFFKHREILLIMKDHKWDLPIRFGNHPVTFSVQDDKFRLGYGGNNAFYVDKWPLYSIAVLLLLLIIFVAAPPVNITFVYNGMDKNATALQEAADIEKKGKNSGEEFEFPIYSEESPVETVSAVFEGTSDRENFRKAFIREREKLIFRYKTRAMVGRLDQLDAQSLLELHQQVARLFTDIVLKNITVEQHVLTFFTDHTDLNKLETALMEQARFHVPASIKLAQSAVETSYGRRIIHNNYFGIKDKKQRTSTSVTTEYYTEAEMKANRSKIISMKKVKRGGLQFYKCRIKDHFSAFETPWQSFRAHSVFLSTSNRYAPLFTAGKDYKDWADKIGSTKYGGVGYATSPIYGKILKGVIQRYHLDLLDF